MTWADFLARVGRRRAPVPEPSPAVRPPAGIDYLLAQAGRSGPSSDPLDIRTPDQAASGLRDPALPSAPDAAPRSAPDTLPRSAPDTVPRSAPDPAPRSAPDAAPRSVPDPAPRSAPDAAPRSAPDPAPRSAPGTVPRNAPDTVLRSPPDPAARSAPDTLPRSAPDTVPPSAPDTVPRNAPTPEVIAKILLDAAEGAQLRGEFTAAEPLWRAIRNRFPHLWHGYVNGAHTLAALGRHDEGRQLLAQAVVRFPSEPAVVHAHARLAISMEDWVTAEATLRAALEFDVRPWWVYTELARAVEQQGRLIEAEAILLHGQAENPDEPSAFINYAQVAWRREDWAAAVMRWAEARRRFPLIDALPAREHEALMRLGEHDQAAYEAALRDLGRLSREEQDRDLVLRFESLGGTGPYGGCEFGCFQRSHGAEPLGLFRWAAVSPASLIHALTARFAGIGEMSNITIAPEGGQWEITDTAYGTRMHSFVSVIEVSSDKMQAMASRRMRYLREKLIADLENPEKIFVLKSGWNLLADAEINALSQALRTYGPANLICACPSDASHPEGEIFQAAPGVFIGYIDFSGPMDVEPRYPAWETLCRKMIALCSRTPAG